MKIPFVDLKAQYASIKKDIDAAMEAVVRETAFVGGKYVKQFEQDFARSCGVPHAIGVSSGTSALQLALLGCGIGPGDEVITTPHTFIATAEAIRMVGAEVKFVDIDPATYNLDPARLPEALTEKTRAILPVHLYGRPADMDPILEFARQHGLKVIGDAAQAVAAEYKGRSIATLGDAVTYSFYPGKNLGAYGDAGAVVTENPHIAEKIRMLRDHGRKDKYEHSMLGHSCRLDGIQAAILSAKLPHLPKWTAARQAHARQYNELLSKIPGITVPLMDASAPSVFHLYVIQLDQRPEFQASMKEKGISTGVHYPIPLHLQPAFSYLGLGRGSFPATEDCVDRIVSLPMYPELTAKQVDWVVRGVEESLEQVLAG